MTALEPNAVATTLEVRTEPDVFRCERNMRFERSPCGSF